MADKAVAECGDQVPAMLPAAPLRCLRGFG
jgi:hypothetical protein